MVYQKRSDFKATINGVNFHAYTDGCGIYIDKLEDGFSTCIFELDYSDPQITGDAVARVYGNLDEWRPTYEGKVRNVSLSEKQRLKLKKKAG